MGLLSGSASVTRCIATSRPDTLEFDDFAFEHCEWLEFVVELKVLADPIVLFSGIDLTPDSRI